MSKHEQLTRRWKRALQKRGSWENGYQEVYDYCLPGRQGFFNRNPTEDSPEIFDETAVIGVQEFASRMQAGMVPNFADWIKLEASRTLPEDVQNKINKELEPITQIVFEHIHASNFAEEAHECLIDIALGTAVMDVHEGDSLDPIVFASVPLFELALEAGPKDEISGFFRARKMHCNDIEATYRVKIGPELRKELGKSESTDANKEEKDNPKVEVVACTYRDHTKQNEYSYRRAIWLPDAGSDNGILYDKPVTGKGACPSIGFRWSKVAGEVWGRGPAYNLMPTIRVLNLVKQLTLENAEMAIAGLYQYDDDGVFNPDNILLRPGTFIPRAPGSSGISQFNASGDFNLAEFIQRDLKEDIKKGLYNETLGSTDTTPMSATEVAQRMADLSRQIGSAFGRLQVEFVNAVIMRVMFILDKRGIIKMPRVDGKVVKIVATSPLAEAQRVENINVVNQWLGIIASTYGPEGVNLYTNGAEVAKYAQKELGVPDRLYRDEQNRAQMVENLATAQQGEQGVGIPGLGG